MTWATMAQAKYISCVVALKVAPWSAGSRTTSCRSPTDSGLQPRHRFLQADDVCMDGERTAGFGGAQRAALSKPAGVPRWSSAQVADVDVRGRAGCVLACALGARSAALAIAVFTFLSITAVRVAVLTCCVVAICCSVSPFFRSAVSA